MLPTAPVRYDWELIAGDTAQPAAFVLQDNSGTAYDLSGVTGVCALRREPGGAVTLEPTVTITDAAAGTFTFAADAGDTAALALGDHVYAVRLTWPSGEVRTIVHGLVTVLPSLVP